MFVLLQYLWLKWLCLSVFGCAYGAFCVHLTATTIHGVCNLSTSASVLCQSNGHRDSSKLGSRSRQQQQHSLAAQQQLLQRPPAVVRRRRLTGVAVQRADLLQVAMASQQAQCVRLVVDALLDGRFSKVSVVLHMYEALQALIHDPQVG